MDIRRLCLSLATVLVFLGTACPAWAHGLIGQRFFPATLKIDDPFVADELSLRYTIVARLGAPHTAGLGERLFRRGRLALNGRSPDPPKSLPSRLRALIAREAVLVLLILGCTAVLVDSTPARHAGHARHQAMTEPSSVRAMEEVHEKRGAPPGGMLTPRAGQSRRGFDREREVRLEDVPIH